MELGRTLGVWLVLAGCRPAPAPAEPEPPTSGAGSGAVVPEREGDGVADELAVADPDPDPDRDGVVVSDDGCPDVAEVKNAYMDGDGCPDEVPPEVAALLGVVPGIEFKFNRWDLLPGSFAVLDRIVEVLLRYPEVRVTVAAHKDAKGSQKYSRRDTQKRADSIRKYLVEHGVAADRVVAIGYEEEVPIADNKTAEGRAKNRRVELHLRQR